MNILLRLIILTAGIFLASYLVPGVNVEGYGPAIKGAILLGLINLVIKPVIMILTLPINILTLGLFTFVLNGLLFWFVGSVVSGFEVAGFLSALAGAIVVSILSIVLNRFI